MERSESDDGAWDDPFDPDSRLWGMPSEPEYPTAPVPAHERRWRHPSELGHAEWVQSERSAGLGRGLLITSGAIGCILGLAVVWLMVPGPADPPTADPNVTRSDLALPTTAAFGIVASTASVVTSRVTAPSSSATLPAAVTVPATVPASPTAATAPAESIPPSSIAMLLPAEDLPTNTVWLKSNAEGAESAVAVLVGDAAYIITTAMAVGSGDTVRVMLASGGMTEMPVVSVDDTFAYLEADDSLRTLGFAEFAVAVAGDSLTVLADEQIVFTYGDNTLAAVESGTIAEGTPVVNENGALVGLCTGASGAVQVVAIGGALANVPTDENRDGGPQPTSDNDPAPSASSSPATSTTIAVSTTTAPSTTTSSSSTTSTTSITTTSVVTTAAATGRKSPWMGIRLGGTDGSSSLTITSITAGGPAEAAGLLVGDQIAAIDGVAVSTVDAVAAAIGAHVPGDVIVVTAVSDGTSGAQHDVSVVLGEHTL